MHQNEKELIARWDHAFEADPAEREKYYLTVAYPYPSGAMHVGHGRTYIVPDVIARFQRMHGKQVLFPMAFHVTGTPVIGISKRIANGDKKTIGLYRNLYKVPQDVLDRFIDPMEIVRYFSEEYTRVMQRCGLSIDWRRRFITIDPQYSKFIEWQYKHLHEEDHVVKGAHPVKYCPQCENPVGDHDLLEGDKAEIIRFTLVMFRWGDALVPCATLRPETTYGVTNLWVNPGTTYVRAKIDGREWIVSPEAAEKLRLQDNDVRVMEDVPGTALIGETVSHPLSGDVPVLPASFVDPDMGSGIVMSVPAHAPFDYIALRDLQQQGKYADITPISLISVEGYGEFPAKDAVERAGITDQNDPAMETLTQEVYSAEFSRGRLHDQYGGKPVREARDDVAETMIAQYDSTVMYEFDIRQVICRCGGRVFVRILHDQWFLEYSDPAWKTEIHDQLAEMALVPTEVRAEFDRTVDWLKDWACTRRVGLGTKLPWDPAWIIEPLSDSTIYMAYYTIAHHLKAISPEKLTPDVFDYIFLGQGAPETVDRATLDAIRGEFLYWYPYDYRFSAKDLISNHLTFQLFHHRAIFPHDLQPQGMVVFGMGLLNGAKMSSSKGNVFLLEDAIEEFGADTVRMFLVGSAEPWQDFDWRNELVSSTRRQIERFWNTIMEAKDAEGTAGIDAWLQSRLQQRIGSTTTAMEAFQTRQALQEAFFGIESDLKWYRRRLPEGIGGAVLQDLCRAWVRLLAPFIPFTCETLWKHLEGPGMVSFADWPVTDEALVNPEIELAEELLLRTVEDIESIVRLIPMEPASINLIVAPAWKHEIFRTVATTADKTRVVREVMKDEEMRKRGRAATDTAQQITKLVLKFPPKLVEQLLETSIDERAVLQGASEFLAKEFCVPVRILTAEESGHPKASGALPFKPAIVIE
ncbi:leucine--tRNA ligase [Methanoculleus sp. FWC-SCC1]|uniref:Leucine--tRNA ligase n=1 Tax=Methanoculleus frigidifontis TaxID=2584085 RepID=A0ABT8MB99_9EURY|nr:leucine--tRNA ligase [Methanoculleus sp. FWC-SCC1]MDN7025202.1 leucine--tRNA ligase [Methanoculleus sp. FWC-SCC1]